VIQSRQNAGFVVSLQPSRTTASYVRTSVNSSTPAETIIDLTAPSRQVIDAAAAEVTARAFLHDDPAAYRAGARDALAAVERMTDPLSPQGAGD
jgi:hypothetical protein